MSTLFITRSGQGSFAVELRTGNPTGQPGVGDVTVLATDVSPRRARDVAEDAGASFEQARQMVDLARVVGLAYIDVPEQTKQKPTFAHELGIDLHGLDFPEGW